MDYDKDEKKLLKRLNQKRPLNKCIKENEVSEIKPIRPAFSTKYKYARYTPIRFKHKNSDYVGYLYPPRKSQNRCAKTLYEFLNFILDIDKKVREHLFIQVERVLELSKDTMVSMYQYKAKYDRKTLAEVQSFPETIYYLVTPYYPSIGEFMIEIGDKLASILHGDELDKKGIKALPNDFVNAVKAYTKLLLRLNEAKLFTEGACPYDALSTMNMVFLKKKNEARLIDLYDVYNSTYLRKSPTFGHLLDPDALTHYFCMPLYNLVPVTKDSDVGIYVRKIIKDTVRE